jgi:hypothetical protein
MCLREAQAYKRGPRNDLRFPDVLDQPLLRSRSRRSSSEAVAYGRARTAGEISDPQSRLNTATMKAPASLSQPSSFESGRAGRAIR